MEARKLGATRWRVFVGAVAAAGLSPIGALALPPGPSFQGLGQLAGSPPSSAAIGMSPLGDAVTGQSVSTAGAEAFRWVDGTGMSGIGDLPNGSFFSLGEAVSNGGDVVVGKSSSSSSNFEAFRWTAAGGMIGLGHLGGFGSDARGVSSDGSIVVGFSKQPSLFPAAFRWDAVNGMQSLGDLPGSTASSAAFDVSDDGTIIVGRGTSANGNEAFRWSEAGGMVGLGDLAGGGFLSVAWAVSGDGATVVGESTSAAGTEAFRWTEAGGMVGLGDLPGGSVSSLALDVSGDGSIVVGEGNFGPTPGSAFVWDATNGMREIRSVLEDAGVDLTGWTLTRAATISSDGTLVGGTGTNPDGDTEAWIARLPGPDAIPMMNGVARALLCVLLLLAGLRARP